jgi:hypothetical protein
MYNIAAVNALVRLSFGVHNTLLGASRSEALPSNAITDLDCADAGVRNFLERKVVA